MIAADRVPHLELRHSAFYWRRRFPGWLQGESNRFLTSSLRTDVASDARELGARLTALTSLACNYAKGCAMRDTKMMETLLTELVRFEIAAFEQARAMTGPRSPEAAELAARREEALRRPFIIATGSQVRAALDAAQALEADGLSVRVVDMHAIGPLDADEIRAAASETARS